MGDGRLIHLQIIADLSDILFSLKQIIKDLDAGGIGEHLEQFRQIDQFLFGDIFQFRIGLHMRISFLDSILNI